MEWWTAFGFGLLGSFHCVGMCGPIAFALPLPKNQPARKVLGILAYNSGRISLYAMAGMLFGLLGKGFFLAGFQQTLSILIGLLIILGVLFPVISRKLFPLTSPFYQMNSKLKLAFQNAFRDKSLSSLYIIGLLNGLLPCGLVYLAIAGSLLTESALQGGAYMALFGLGTFPLMAAVSLTGSNIRVSLRNRIRKMMPVVLLFFGLLFVLRGLNLGIPYLSPKITVEAEDVKACH